MKLQQKISSTKSKDKTVVIDCNFPSDCSSYIHWYQLKEGQTLKRILYASIADGTLYSDAGFESFKVDKKQGNLALKIPELKKEHSAMYYCACWVSGSTVVINTETLYKNSAGFLIYSKTTIHKLGYIKTMLVTNNEFLSAQINLIHSKECLWILDTREKREKV